MLRQFQFHDAGTGGKMPHDRNIRGQWWAMRHGFLVKVVTQATKNLQLTGSIDPFSVRIPVSPPDIRPLRSRVLLRLHHRHVAQVTVKLIVVETEADDEAVGNLETAELHGDLDEPAGIAVQESAHGQRVGAAAGERLQKVAQRQSGIHDILHQQHIFVFDAIVQILGDAHDARRAGFVREGGDSQKIDLYRNLNVARQRGEKEHRALEHTHQLERLAPVALADFRGHLLDALRNLLFGGQDAFDTRWRILAHAFTAPARPYLKIRFSKSF